MHEAKEWGGTVHPVECLNTDEQWCKDFAKYTLALAEGSAKDKENLEYQLTAEDYLAMPKLLMEDDGMHQQGIGNSAPNGSK